MDRAKFSTTDARFMNVALRLARRGCGRTSPNPMVGAVLVKDSRIIGQGWHKKAGEPHAEINAIASAQRRGNSPIGATLYLTLEPCSTTGRTPPCTKAIIDAGIRRVLFACLDPNPAHRGRAARLLRAAGINVASGLCEAEGLRLIEAFAHWIQTGRPFVHLKAAMTLDGKIATASGESKWITGARARAASMKMRLEADAILVGVGTVIADDPALTHRVGTRRRTKGKELRRIILDSTARTPASAKVVSDAQARLTMIVVTRSAPARRVAALASKVRVVVAPALEGKVDGRWLLEALGREAVVQLLVEGGSEVHASFLRQGLAHRVSCFYAPMVLGGRDAKKAVGGTNLMLPRMLRNVEWRRVGDDLLMSARLDEAPAAF